MMTSDGLHKARGWWGRVWGGGMRKCGGDSWGSQLPKAPPSAVQNYALRHTWILWSLVHMYSLTRVWQTWKWSHTVSECNLIQLTERKKTVWHITIEIRSSIPGQILRNRYSGLYFSTWQSPNWCFIMMLQWIGESPCLRCTVSTMCQYILV